MKVKIVGHGENEESIFMIAVKVSQSVLSNVRWVFVGWFVLFLVKSSGLNLDCQTMLRYSLRNKNAVVIACCTVEKAMVAKHSNVLLS